MKARLHWWLHEWDWRPLARMIVWLGIGVLAVRRSGCRLPDPGRFVRELVLGWLLTFGILTQLQVWIAMAALRLFMALDDWTYAASEWLVRPIAGRAPFAVNFAAALMAQIVVVLGGARFVPKAIAVLLRRL